MTLAFILRVNMSVGIVAMTDPDAGNQDYPVSWYTVVFAFLLEFIQYYVQYYYLVYLLRIL